jgi:hypothetical protein
MTVRVLIADDHPLVRAGLQAAPAPVPEVEVVAEAATGQAAIREAVLHRPDVVVMDLQMPELNGIEATRELARAIAAVAAGEAIFGPGIATRLLTYFASPPATPTPFPGAERPGTRGPGPAGRRPHQPPDRRTARPQRQDRRQPPLGHLRQAPGGRPHPGRPARPRRRPRPPLTTRRHGLERPDPAGGATCNSAQAPLCEAMRRSTRDRKALWWAWSLLAEQRRRGRLISHESDGLTAVVPVHSFEIARRAGLLMTVRRGGAQSRALRSAGRPAHQ